MRTHTTNSTLIARLITEVQLRQILEQQIVGTTVVVIAAVIASLHQHQSCDAVILTEGLVIRQRALSDTVIGVVRSLLQRVLRAQARIGLAHRVVDLVDVAILIIRETTQRHLIRGRERLGVLEGHIVRCEELCRQALHPRHIPTQRDIGLNECRAALILTRLHICSYGIDRCRSGRGCGVILNTINCNLFRYVGMHTHSLLRNVVPSRRISRVGRLIVNLNTTCNTHIEGKALGDLCREIYTSCIATEIKIIDITLLVEHTHRGKVVHTVVAAIGRNRVRHICTYAEHLVVPIGITPAILTCQHLLHDIGCKDRLLAIEFQRLIVPIGVSGAVKQLQRIGIRADTIITLIRDGRFAILTTLGGYDDDRITVKTINRSCRSIFQNRDRLDIFGVDLVDITGHTIDDVESRLTTYHNRRRIGTGLTRRLHSRYTRYTTCQHIGYAAHRCFFELFTRNLRD